MLLGELILYGLLALLVVVSGLGMLMAKNAVYAALFLVLNFATVAVLYLILGAPFIALAQVSVYAGAIMVLFLFVIMLLGAEAVGGRQLRIGSTASRALAGWLRRLRRHWQEPTLHMDVSANALLRMVADGHLGRKTGRGFHDYS